jgi:hypothetical protein
MTETLLLLGRPECGLCEEMEIGLRSHPGFAGIGLMHADVDSQADWQRRYGLRVPVLLDRWNEVVCEGHFDADAFSTWRHEIARRGV